MPTEFMDSRRRSPGSSCEDELALVKAAAWAWYQHGSANEGKPTSEFQLAKTPRQPRPSRYKLEAAAASASDDPTTDGHLAATSLESLSPAAKLSLLDPYEIDRITRHLDRLVVATSRRGRRVRRGPKGGGKATAKAGGFWLRLVVGLCSSKADVAEAGLLVGGHRSSCSQG